MYPLNIYIKEILWRIYYCILGLVAIFIISFYYIELIFLFEIFPFIKLSHKKFIATHITELFDSVLQTCFSMVSINGFPLVTYHIFTFFISSWFNYQITLMRYYLLFLSFSFFFSFSFTNIFLLPKMFSFFTQWETVQKNVMVHVGLETRIFLYTQWINCTYNSISFFCSLLLLFLFLILLFITPLKLYFFTKLYKKQILFAIILVLFILLPPDLWVQLLLVFSSFLLLELLFFMSCFRFNRTKHISDSSNW
jgi:Sec-independent protein secretion pathway component TatC